jgi:flagellar basal-body rod modification protein FlgD
MSTVLNVGSTTSTTTGSSATGFGSSATDLRDQFLHLLVVQLQHQDPMNPISDQNFTAELAQFSSLEQLTQVNKNLQGLGGIQQQLVNAQTLNLLGRRVLVPGTMSMHASAGKTDPIYVNAPENATDVKISVKDASGNVVRTINVPAGTGRRVVAWDGNDSQGRPLADGDYTLEVKAMDSTGKAVDASLFVSILIDGISFGTDGVMLSSNGRQINYDQIQEIQAI